MRTILEYHLHRAYVEPKNNALVSPVISAYIELQSRLSILSMLSLLYFYLSFIRHLCLCFWLCLHKISVEMSKYFILFGLWLFSLFSLICFRLCFIQFLCCTVIINIFELSHATITNHRRVIIKLESCSTRVKQVSETELWILFIVRYPYFQASLYKIVLCFFELCLSFSIVN